MFWKNDLQKLNNTVMWCNSSPTDLMKIRTYIVFSHNPWGRLVNIMKQVNSKRTDDECFEGRAVSNVTLYSYAFVMWQLGIHTSSRASVSCFATMARAHLWITLSKYFFEWVNYIFKQIQILWKPNIMTIITVPVRVHTWTNITTRRSVTSVGFLN